MSFDFRSDFGAYLRRSGPASLPPDMRAMIDQAISEGRVTRVPTGQCAIPYPVWDKDKVVLVETAEIATGPGAMTQHFYSARQALLDRQSARAAARREEIAGLVKQGLGYREIAAMRGEGLESTRKIVQAIRRELRAANGEGVE